MRQIKKKISYAKCWWKYYWNIISSEFSFRFFIFNFSLCSTLKRHCTRQKHLLSCFFPIKVWTAFVLFVCQTLHRRISGKKSQNFEEEKHQFGKFDFPLITKLNRASNFKGFELHTPRQTNREKKSFEYLNFHLAVNKI